MATDTKKQRRLESVRKWSGTVMKAAFSILPAVLFEKQKELKLGPTDMNILLQLACHWWKAAKMPYPSKATLAKRLGVDRSTIRRRVAALEAQGMLKRVKRTDDGRGQRSNYYDLRPLVEKLHPLAIQSIKEKHACRKRRKEASS